MAAYIRTNDHLTVTFDNGESVTVYPSNAYYKEIVAALGKKDYDTVKRLASPKAVVQDKIEKVQRRGVSSVELRDGVVYYKNEPIHNSLTNRIVAMANEGYDIEPMCLFLENLQQNPSYRAVNELYGFLEKGNLPITEDGYFLAYKNVDQNYMDCYTHKIDNSVGKEVKMDRNKVNEDPNKTCEQGLHFCSRSYLPHYNPGQHTMVLKINPADVVAIPTDYNDAKGRCCRYVVIGEIGRDGKLLDTDKLEGSFRPSENYVPPEDDPPTSTDNTELQKLEERVDRLDPKDGSVLETLDIKAAAEKFGVEVSAIRRVARGDRKTTGGWSWQFTTSEPVLASSHVDDNDWDDDDWDDNGWDYGDYVWDDSEDSRY